MSCELIRGYELQLSADIYFPPASTVIRHIGANETFYIIKDEDKMGASGEEKFYVQVAMPLSLHIKLVTINITGYATLIVQIRVIYSNGESRWGLYGNLGKASTMSCTR